VLGEEAKCHEPLAGFHVVVLASVGLDAAMSADAHRAEVLTGVVADESGGFLERARVTFAALNSNPMVRLDR
jgi:hypothetical protein